MPLSMTWSMTIRHMVRKEFSLASNTNSMSWMYEMISPLKSLIAMWKW